MIRKLGDKNVLGNSQNNFKQIEIQSPNYNDQKFAIKISCCLVQWQEIGDWKFSIAFTR